ncbi:hypothetical protein NIES25_52360 [Nostoc linckia NIES-25]|nr:hypothetical protein NIES25_52360 [Nostoc linckia NIES-25]
MYKGFAKIDSKNYDKIVNTQFTKKQILEWIDSKELRDSFKKALDSSTPEVKTLLEVFKSNLHKTGFRKHISMWHPNNTVMGLDTKKWEFWVHVGMPYGIVKFDDQLLTLKSFMQIRGYEHEN